MKVIAASLRQRAKKWLAALLAGITFLSPTFVCAKEVAPIVLPAAQVTVKSAHPVPCTLCEIQGGAQEPEVDPPTGLLRAPGQPFGQPPASPALMGSPTYISGNHTVTIWGLGWFSENDQTVNLNVDGSITWTQGDGTETIYNRISASSATVPAYAPPTTYFSTMTAVTVLAGVPTAISERDPDGTTRLFGVFDSTTVLRLSRLTDRNGNFVAFARDSAGRLTRITDVHGRYFALTLNSAGLVSQLDDSAGRSETFLYDSSERRVSETGPAGKVTYSYDSQNRLITITYPNGGVHNYTYDSQNRVLTEDEGTSIDLKTYSYGPNSTTISDALGHRTTMQFVQSQGLKRPSKITDAAGNVTAYTYDSRFNVATQTDSLGRVTHFSYDNQGSITQLEDALGDTTSASYEPQFGQPTALTDALGNTVSLSYDASGNPTQVKDPLSNTAHFTYDSFGHVTQSQDPLGNITQFAYDPSNGAVASVTDPLNRKVAMQTDALSRITQITDASGNSRQYAYDFAGDLTQVTDAQSSVTRLTYASGRQTKVLSSFKDALNHTTALNYDPQGRLTRVTNALGESGTIGYEANSLVSSFKTRNGQVISMAYDTLDRLIGVTTPEGSRNLSYDAVGNLTSVNAPNGSALGFSYDQLDRIAGMKETLDNGFSDSLTFTYDANGNRTAMSSTLGNYTYNYDALSHLSTLTGANGTIRFEYDADGRPISITYPNGTETTLTYDAAGQVLRVLHQRLSDQSPVASVSYAYDVNGNRTSILDQAGAHTYTYDRLNQITSATHPSASSLPILNESFTYDAIGNRTSDESRTNYLYDAANRIVSDSSYTYTSDANGNRTSQTSIASGEAMTFKYDSGNALMEVDGPGGAVIASYNYDPLHRRIAKTVANVVTRYVYDGGNVKAILDGDNSVIASFTYVPGLSAPLIMQVLPTTRSDFKPGTYFFHADALGNVVALTDANGQAVETYQYESFGRTIVRDAQGTIHDRSTVGNPFMYAGAFYDPETGYYHMGFRDEDPDSGRFLEEDPVPSINQFSYAGNNPITAADPTGLTTKGETGGTISDGAFALYQVSDEPGSKKVNYGVTLAGIGVGARFAIDVSELSQPWMIVGGAAGFAALDVGQQVARNKLNHRKISDINWKSVGMSAAAGAVSLPALPMTKLFGAFGASVLTNTMALGLQRFGFSITREIPPPNYKAFKQTAMYPPAPPHPVVVQGGGECFFRQQQP